VILREGQGREEGRRGKGWWDKECREDKTRWGGKIQGSKRDV